MPTPPPDRAALGRERLADASPDTSATEDSTADDSSSTAEVTTAQS